ncbi:hypothetical protein PG985_002995 [Apiospora marii]|uniref:uncharacterized protein n=1 Tax=Apiospora marii TaxID=335849 RepID=UPI00312EBCBB
MAYGYTLKGPAVLFNRAQRNTIEELGLNMCEASPKDLFFPFFIIEYKSDAGRRTVAQNQCLGGSATCVAIINRLNELLGKYPRSQEVCNVAFSFVIDLQHAELFISWMGDSEEDEDEDEDDDDDYEDDDEEEDDSEEKDDEEEEEEDDDEVDEDDDDDGDYEEGGGGGGK